MTGRTWGNQHSPAIGIRTLWRRGWSTAAVHALLGEPDETLPTLRWDRQRVLAAEAAPGWAVRVSQIPGRKHGSEPTINLGHIRKG
jgi:hypothetical protein